LEFQPGEGYDYSNVGYSLLAMVIEEVSGKSYEEYLQENLFNPSGMNQTGYLIPDWDDKNFAIGYRKEKRWGSVYEHFKTSGPSWHLKGNGGIHSTAEDMVKWHNALMGNTILSEDAKNKMYTAHVREGNSDVFYGYGYTIRRPYDDQKLLVKHNGGNGIFFADYLRFIDDNLVIFLATNAVDSKFDYFGFEIADIINIKDYMPEMIDYSKIKILDSLPDDLQGERAIKFLEMISSENTETVLKDFIQGNFSEDLIERRGEDQLITIIKDLYTRIGQHELIKVEILKKTQYKVYLNPDKSPDWYIISFLYEETEKYLIRGLNLDITSPEN